MASDDPQRTELERHYRSVALLWLAFAVIAVLAAVVVFLYYTKTWPFEPAPEPIRR